MNGNISIDYICKVLAERKLISPEQKNTILKKEDSQRKRLTTLKEIQEDRDLHRDVSLHEISPVDIISSLKLNTTNGKNGKKAPLTEEMVVEAVADDLGFPFKKIDPLELDIDIVTRTIPKPFAIKNLAIPIALENGELKVAMFDPTDSQVIEDIQRVVNGLKLSPVMSTKNDIIKIINEFYGFKSSIIEAEKELVSPTIDLGNLEQYIKLKSTTEIQYTDTHIKNAVNYLLNYAFEQRASDIHIEPKREKSEVRFRIDGVLHPVYNLPKIVHSAVISRIKTLARIDIAEKRRPQDGRIKAEQKGKEVEIRVSTVPVAFGEKAVLRVLDPNVLFQDLEELGFFPAELITFHSFLQKTHGIILVTGPTGSGKTTTLYSALRYLSSPEKNIVTIEEPIEMIHEEFNQIAVQPQVGITFANTLRNILRQDPDIIMVGEIRDYETAQNAVQSALTGHLVLSTLHTNDAVSSVSRLLDLGIESFLVNSTVIGILAQRLVRKICPHCRETFTLNPEDVPTLSPLFKEKGEIELKRGKGCRECRGTGYLGRVGIFEVLDVTGKISKLINEKSDIDGIKKVAQEEGMVTLQNNGIKNMLKGITTYTEVMRVTNMD